MNLLINKTSKGILMAITVIFLLATWSCSHYYQVSKTSKQVTPDSLISANPTRYFILRSGTNAYYMDSITLSQDRKSLSCKLEELWPGHKLHLRNGRGGSMRYKAGQPEAAVLNEIHLYVPKDNAAVTGKNYVLQLSDITKVEVLEKDHARTIASYVLGGLGVTVGVVLVAAVIVAATKSSCPFVSAYDGNNMALQGEIYGGAIYPQMARDDYMELKMKPSSPGHLKLKISNELKERQYTDLAELMVVTHDKNVQILVDETGKLYSVSNPIPPLTAIAADKDVLSMINHENDDKCYSFDDTTATTGVNQLNLTFARRPNAKKAKLILRLKNSYWMDVTYGKMTEGFGSYYGTFIKQQYNKPLAELKQWVKEQEIPLHIALNTASGLQNVADLTTAGPLATREIVVPLDLAGLNGNEIQLQLSTGFMFWDIDYAAIDFSDDTQYSVSTLIPNKATDETGRDVTKLLAVADGKYLEQPVPGNAVDIDYLAKPNTDPKKTQTFILHAKGYYEHVRNFKTSLDLGFLEQFKKPNGFSRYSLQLYKATLSNNLPPMFAAR